MSTSAKIRLLLGIVCATFLSTALIVKETFTPAVNLTQTATILQNNLNDKEGVVNELSGTKAALNRLKHITDHPDSALDFITEYTAEKRVWVYTYINNDVKFWTGVKVFPEALSKYKEGPQFRQLIGGDFEVIKKTDGNFTALFFIPVQNRFHFQNQYLQNGFEPKVLDDNNLEIADITDKDVFPIHSLSHTYLFAVKLVPGAINHRFYYFELLLWLFGFLTLCTLVHNTSNYIAIKGYGYWALGLMTSFIALIRFVSLHYNIPNLSNFDIFDQHVYSAGIVFPSLGDFCINMLLGCWLASFIFHHKHRFVKNTSGNTGSYGVILLCSGLLVMLATWLLSLYYGLVIKSDINFDVTNVFNLSGFSVVGILMLCFSFLLFYLITDTFLVITKRITIPDRHKAGIFGGVVLIGTLVTLIEKDFSMFYVLAGLFVLIRAYAVWYGDGKLNAASFLSLIAVCALISSSKLNHFQEIKNAGIRRELIHKLEVSDDEIADRAFPQIEKSVINDQKVFAYFSDPDRNDDYLKTHFQKTYFDGYLTRYGVKFYAFDSTGQPISGDKSYLLNDFRDMVEFSSMKVNSGHFYHQNDSFGLQRYFAILPIYQNAQNLGTLVIALEAKSSSVNTTFPELLINGEFTPDEAYKDYSYAYYTDGQLQSQYGKFSYNLTNANFAKLTKNYAEITTKSPSTKWYKPLARYRHLIYRPSNTRYMLVISNEEDPIAQGITSLTFFFVTLLAFTAVATFIYWVWTRIRIFNIKNKQLKWGLRINVEKILYRSRIQFSVVFTVVFTLLLIGAITFKSISNQYKDQQDEMIRDKISTIGAVFEAGLQHDDYSTTQAGQVRFNEFANTYQVDLTLYNTDGVALISTQPKIYDYGLLARRMNGRSFINMKYLNRSVFLNDEQLGSLKYKAAYVPVLDKDKKHVKAYLQLPYFSNEADYNDRIGSLLNAMINVYALVFIAIGLFAIVIARQITSPLIFIQHSLSKTIYGQKNEPIIWDRDDEIGALVKEYNKMIAELEASAQRLAQSERESAWREMAKQVAHEIKNPLTPLKLGLQLLDKAWKDKDPKFDQKFERFSKSFVEQIESLSSIASEFSSFAKMPDTKLEIVNVFDIISQAVIIFKQMDNVTIDFNPTDDPFRIRADRDQLLRCFNNLLKNAIEAMPEGRQGEISISFKINNGNILVIVADNGNGIPENLREKIFAPNFTTKSSGTGLGLAFVKNSIENAGGKVWFETEMGKGTTFFLSMPEAVA